MLGKDVLIIPITKELEILRNAIYIIKKLEKYLMKLRIEGYN